MRKAPDGAKPGGTPEIPGFSRAQIEGMQRSKKLGDDLAERFPDIADWWGAHGIHQREIARFAMVIKELVEEGITIDQIMMFVGICGTLLSPNCSLNVMRSAISHAVHKLIPDEQREKLAREHRIRTGRALAESRNRNVVDWTPEKLEFLRDLLTDENYQLSGGRSDLQKITAEFNRRFPDANVNIVYITSVIKRRIRTVMG